MNDTGLASFGRGDSGVIEGVVGALPSSKRLADLGFVRGAMIMMVYPGIPCIVRISGRCVGLGAEHQRSIKLSTM